MRMPMLALLAAVLVLAPTLAQVNEDCPPRWIMYDRCYFFSIDKDQFHSAQRKCMRMNASLIEIHDDDINTWVGNEVSTRNIRFAWIGGELDPSGTFRWTSGAPTNFVKWDDGEPNSYSPSGSGIIITEGVWNDKPKDKKYGSVCAKAKPAPPSTLLHTTTEASFMNVADQSAVNRRPDGDQMASGGPQSQERPSHDESMNNRQQSSVGDHGVGSGQHNLNMPSHVAEDCPPKWIMYDRCYFFAEDMKKFHAAQAVCMRMNASLIEIHDDNINTWVGNEVSKRGGIRFAWIGGELDISGTFRWTSGAPTNFVKWDDGEPNSYSPGGSGIIITEGVWNDKPKDKKYGFVCAKAKPTPPSTVLPTATEANESANNRRPMGEQLVGGGQYNQVMPSHDQSANNPRPVGDHLTSGGQHSQDVPSHVADQSAVNRRPDEDQMASGGRQSQDRPSHDESTNNRRPVGDQGVGGGQHNQNMPSHVADESEFSRQPDGDQMASGGRQSQDRPSHDESANNRGPVGDQGVGSGQHNQNMPSHVADESGFNRRPDGDQMASGGRQSQDRPSHDESANNRRPVGNQGVGGRQHNQNMPSHVADESGFNRRPNGDQMASGGRQSQDRPNHDESANNRRPVGDQGVGGGQHNQNMPSHDDCWVKEVDAEAHVVEMYPDITDLEECLQECIKIGGYSVDIDHRDPPQGNTYCRIYKPLHEVKTDYIQGVDHWTYTCDYPVE